MLTYWILLHLLIVYVLLKGLCYRLCQMYMNFFYSRFVWPNQSPISCNSFFEPIVIMLYRNPVILKSRFLILNSIKILQRNGTLWRTTLCLTLYLTVFKNVYHPVKYLLHFSFSVTPYYIMLVSFCGCWK